MRTWLVAAGVGLVAIGGAAFAQQNLTELSSERRALMRQQIQAVRAIGPVVQSGGDPRSVQQQAETLLATAQRKLTLFPPGSDLPDDRARPEIWTNRAEFEQAGQMLIVSAQRLVAASAAGDRPAFAEAFRATTGACASCHERFQIPQR